MEKNKIQLDERMQKFILRWGELASHWGLNRMEVQIHVLLFLSTRPLAAEEIAYKLSMARSSVSVSLKSLQQWGLARIVRLAGDRRDHYETTKDVWETFRIAAKEQKRREIEPILSALRDTLAEFGSGSGNVEERKRLSDLHEFFEAVSTWFDSMRAVPTPLLRQMIKMGSKVSRLLQKK